MSEQPRTNHRKFLLPLSLLGIAAMFLCGAFFLWLAMGANLNKLPTNVQAILQPITDNISKNMHTVLVNSSSGDSPTQESDSNENNSNETDNTNEETDTNEPTENDNCMIGFSFDPIAEVCVEDDQSPPATESPDDSSSNQTCSVGLIFDPVLETCVQVQVPAIDMSGSSSPDTSTSNSNECSIGLTLDPILGACIDINVPSSEPEPEATEAPIVDLSIPESITTELPGLPITLP